MTLLNLAISISNSNLTDLENDDRVLSSATLWAGALLMQYASNVFNMHWIKLTQLMSPAEPLKLCLWSQC